MIIAKESNNSRQLRSTTWSCTHFAGYVFARLDSMPFSSPYSDRRCVRHLDNSGTDVTTAPALTRLCVSVTRSYLILVYIFSSFFWPLELASPHPYISISADTWKEKESITSKEGKNIERKEGNITEENIRENRNTREENVTRCWNTHIEYSSRGWLLWTLAHRPPLNWVSRPND